MTALTDSVKFGEPDQKAYFERISQGPKLDLLDRPCNDCAITTGFYTPYAEELLEQEPGLQTRVLDTWYCHNDCNKACRGAYNYIQVKNKKE